MSGAVRVLCRCLCVREREREKSMERLEWEKMSCGSVCVPERNVLDRCTPQRINRRTWMNTNIKILHGLKVYIYLLNERFVSLYWRVFHLLAISVFFVFSFPCRQWTCIRLFTTQNIIYILSYISLLLCLDRRQSPPPVTDLSAVSFSFSLSSPHSLQHTHLHIKEHTHKYMCETWLDLMTRLREKLVGLGLRSPAMRLSTFLAACPRVHRGAKCGFGCRDLHAGMCHGFSRLRTGLFCLRSVIPSFPPSLPCF